MYMNTTMYLLYYIMTLKIPNEIAYKYINNSISAD